MTIASIALGFEVDTGAPVAVPLKHLAITGQTQEAGKTTALEALITRAGLRALTFVTKRGEASFQTSRRIDPYFRERADWQFVAAILEASRGEKLKFERAWIIRASRGARTLADVQRNVRHAMEKARGMSADVYLTLDAYLDVVVPQIASIRWAPGLALQPGVNAMDLTSLAMEMQHLVIRSSVEWVLEREAGVVVVVPEAWKFIPQGRGTPVKLAAEAFVRQAAALQSYLWLDSQDLGGIDKTILRSVPLWILGVQREANEVKRTLDNIPAGTAKPSPADIATLELGHFYACWGKHAIKTYVQPAWLDADAAKAVARGAAVTVEPTREETDVTPTDAQALREENARLSRQVQELTDEVRRLRASAPPPSPLREVTVRPTGAAASAPNAGVLVEGDEEARYQAIKARLLAELPREPVLLKILAARPELTVEVTRQTVTADGSGNLGWTARLVAEGFFDEPQTANAAWTEMRRRGYAGVAARIYESCASLHAKGFLTKEADGYQAVPGMKINIVER